ncbi:hypothetical protein [Streptomyces brasiliensis]|uniref:Uncharacterized protein n=1 Tax=Streptomyces brasiliensis TaxID=1954 RepID=A0A917PEV3_9ACTN|nr:hypothetical protein [Streptomyces brasiliensis]GGJ72888.1 hypothetical protein GCM10010121_099360 [Streptomyces brasiliensis]
MVRSSLRAATALGLALYFSSTVAGPALADDGPSGTGVVGDVSVVEQADLVTGAQETQDASGAYRGDVLVRFTPVADAGFHFEAGTGEAAYTTRVGSDNYSSVTVSSVGTGYFTLDTRNLPDGHNTLDVTVTETTDDTGSGATAQTIRGTVSLTVTNPSAVFTSPQAHTLVWGATTYTVDAQSATGGSAIDHVDFYETALFSKSNKPRATDDTAPYTYTSTYSTMAFHPVVQAVAVDKDGYRSAPVSLQLTATPGPTVTATTSSPQLAYGGADSMDMEWTAAVPYGWNRMVSDPKYYEVWLTKEEVAVDGRTVRSYADGDNPVSPLQVQNGGYHHINTTWGDGLDTSTWSVGKHTVTVTVTDSTGAVGTASVQAVVTADKLTATAPGAVVLGQNVKVTGLLTAGTGNPLAYRAVSLQARPAGSTAWKTVATGTTDGNGRIALTTKPARNESLRMVAAAGTKPVSAAPKVSVSPKVTLKASATRVRHGATVKFSGTVSSKERGATVKLQVYRSGAWKTLASKPQSSTGQVTFTLGEKTKGTFTYRLHTVATTSFAAAHSSSVKIAVS